MLVYQRIVKNKLPSYEAQVDYYYTNYIKAEMIGNLVDIYTDDGISATNTKHREGF